LNKKISDHNMGIFVTPPELKPSTMHFSYIGSGDFLDEQISQKYIKEREGQSQTHLSRIVSSAENVSELYDDSTPIYSFQTGLKMIGVNPSFNRT
jgi:predicted RNA-binding protein